MSAPIRFVTQNFPGCGITDGRFLPCSGVSGRTVSLSPCSPCGPYKILTPLKSAPLKCTSSRLSIVCNFSRENKRGYSRNRNNCKDDERDGFESLDESDDVLSSKNGTSSSASNPSKNQDVLEIFRNVQKDLRLRAAKGEKKTTTELNRSHKDEGVDILLKTLMENTNRTKIGKTGSSSSGSNRGFILEEPESNGALKKDKSTLDSILDESEQYGSFERKRSAATSDSRNNLKDKTQGQGHETPTFSRPASNFQRRSPVPQVKPQQSVTDRWVNGNSKMVHPDPQTSDHGIEMESEPGFSQGIEFGGMLEEEDSEIHDGYNDDELEEDKPIIDEDLSGMKLTELRAVAKSRGVKGYSKLKKHELVELLSAGGST